MMSRSEFDSKLVAGVAQIGGITAFMFACAVTGTVLWFAYTLNYGWTPLQFVVAGWMAFDLAGGVITFRSMPSRPISEDQFPEYMLHNLSHVHPLMAAVFYTGLLDYVFVLHLGLVMLYLTLFTTRLRPGQTLGIVLTGAVSVVITLLILAILEFWQADRVYGIGVYVTMIVLTTIIYLPAFARRRVASVIAVVVVVGVAALFVRPPFGFAWLLPIYLTNLLVSYAARGRVLTD